ncbi:MAG: photosystem reaction center subunit H, partial [Leptolyngbyaceae cyanobacterium CRU_2_3]|nr:photosystem reaction center subunit H [Leptolyngbyaceae cyanobacterium CRU_2_3]
DNWGGRSDSYEDVEYEEVADTAYPEPKYVADENVTNDAWADDDNPTPYRAPEVNIPERKRVVEYEEETDY